MATANIGGFYEQIWANYTFESMVKALKENQYIVNSICDYTNKTLNVKAEAYNGPRLGTLEAVEFPIADSKFKEISKDHIHIPFDQKWGVPFTVNDIDQAMTQINFLKECGDIAKDALLEKYDRYIVALMIANAAAKEVLSGTKILQEEFKKARKILNAQKAPTRGRYAALSVEHE